MRSLPFAVLLVSATLVACVSAGSDDGESSEAEVHASFDGGAATDATATSSDAGTPVVTDASSASTDGGSVVTDASVPSVPTYAEVAPLIHATCGGCHHTSFDTLAKVKANRTRMLGMISAGRMPKNNPGWKNTDEGLDVLDFLQNSPELQ